MLVSLVSCEAKVVVAMFCNDFLKILSELMRFSAILFRDLDENEMI